MADKVSEMLAILQQYYSDFLCKKNLPFVVKNSVPVAWFGDCEKYFTSEKRVVTVGLNPSTALSTVSFEKFILFPNGGKLRRETITDGLNFSGKQPIGKLPTDLSENIFLRSTVNRGAVTLLSINSYKVS